MAKKLFVVWLAIPIILFSSISIYASYEESAQSTAAEQVMAESLAVAETTMQEANAIVKKAEKEAEREAKEKEEQKYFDGLSAYIRHINGNVTEEEADTMVESFIKYGKKYDVDEKVVMAIAQNESTYYADAVSCEDYKGLMQTGDGLARNAGYDPGQLFNPEVSIKVGARYLGIKMDEFGDLRLALTAYNQGSGSVHSGNYTTGYADLAMERTAAMEDFLVNNGYI